MQIIDVTSSSNVTDRGIAVLCDPQQQVDWTAEDDPPPRRRRVSTTMMMDWFLHLVRRRRSGHTGAVTISRRLGDCRFNVECYRSSCIGSLRKLDVTGTRVTQEGVQMLLRITSQVAILI